MIETVGIHRTFHKPCRNIECHDRLFLKSSFLEFGLLNPTGEWCAGNKLPKTLRVSAHSSINHSPKKRLPQPSQLHTEAEVNAIIFGKATVREQATSEQDSQVASTGSCCQQQASGGRLNFFKTWTKVSLPKRLPNCPRGFLKASLVRLAAAAEPAPILSGEYGKTKIFRYLVLI